MSLVDAEYVRSRIQGLTTDDDTEITEILGVVDRLLACHLLFPTTSGGAYTLAASEYVDRPRRLDEDDPRAARLRVRPVVSVDDAEIDGVALDLTDVEIDPEEGIIRLSEDLGDLWPPTGRSAVVTYTAGWESGGDPPVDPPADVVQAILLCVGAIWRQRHVETLPNAAEVAAQAGPIPPQALPLLAPYRLVERLYGAP